MHSNLAFIGGCNYVEARPNCLEGGRTQTNYDRYPDGSVAHLHYPGGAYVRHDYTARGQLAATGWDDDDNNCWMQLAHYTYLADGKVGRVDYGNGVQSAIGYDERGFINAIDHYNVPLNHDYSSRQYWRDDRDRITAFQKSYNPGANPMEDGRGDRFAYDNEGQLTDAWYNAVDPHGTTSGWMRKDHFDYDALGNRQGSSNNVASRSSGSTPITFSRRDNGLNQYSSWSPSIIYHDDNYPGWSWPGNGVTMAEGWVTASYNALNQPIAIWSPNMPAGAFTWFGYDPLGRCVKRWVSDSGDIYSNPATYFHYDGWDLLQEGMNAWGPARVYVHGNRVDEIVWSYNTFTGDQAFHQYDARGHCTLLTDSLGDILEQYEYDAFGQAYFYDAAGGATLVNSQPGSPFGNRFLFTGREYLSDLKLYDYRNRMYQPELGRFLQPDPKEFAAGDYNLYRYCHNDPVNKTDWNGLDFTDNAPRQEVDSVAPGYVGQTILNNQIAIGRLATAEGYKLVLQRFDVQVVSVKIAREANGHPLRSSQITALHDHEEKHVTDSHAYHDSVHKNPERYIPPGPYPTTEKADAAARKAGDAIKAKLDNETNEKVKHEGPEWKSILDRQK